MGNHCVDVICKTCGVIYCARCFRLTQKPDLETIKRNDFRILVENTKCINCKSETLYIY